MSIFHALVGLACSQTHIYHIASANWNRVACSGQNNITSYQNIKYAHN